MRFPVWNIVIAGHMYRSEGGAFMNRQPEITDATRSAFFDAYFQMRQKKELSKITVRNITEITGNSRSTFYRYFEDVYALDAAFLESVYSELGMEILKSFGDIGDEKAFTDDLCGIYERWGPRIDLIFSDQYRNGVHVQLKEYIYRNMFPDAGGRIVSERTLFLIDAYVSVVVSVIGRWVLNRDSMSLQELAGLLKDVLDQGLCHEIRKIREVRL